jgi:hypothetical protein
MVPPFAGILVDDPEDGVALAESMVAALTRDWDTRRIRDHVSMQSWDEVAQRVIAQWLLAVETPRAETAGGPSALAEDLVTAATRSPEA